MKPVIIIAIAFVLLIPTSVFAQYAGNIANDEEGTLTLEEALELQRNKIAKLTNQNGIPFNFKFDRDFSESENDTYYKLYKITDSRNNQHVGDLRIYLGSSQWWNANAFLQEKDTSGFSNIIKIKLFVIHTTDPSKIGDVTNSLSYALKALVPEWSEKTSSVSSDEWFSNSINNAERNDENKREASIIIEDKEITALHDDLDFGSITIIITENLDVTYSNYVSGKNELLEEILDFPESESFGNERTHEITLDKSEYYIGETIIITGKIIPGESSKHLARAIYDSQGNSPSSGGGSYTIDESGEYVYKETVGGYEPGLYTIRITVNELTAEAFFTVLGYEPEPIPTIETNQSSYNYGDILEITGSLFNNERKTEILITDPSNKIVVEESMLPLLDGTISKSYDTSTSSWAESGEYVILISTDFQKAITMINFTGPIPYCGTGTIEKDGICVVDYPDLEPSSKGGGCLIATATYGSELAPEVQKLRELRDNSLLSTESGTNFMSSFNDFYYSFSPIIADYERENPIFKEMVKIAITPMITSLSILNYVDMDSEVEVLVYGTSLIILNGMMYVGIPILTIMRIRK